MKRKAFEEIPGPKTKKGRCYLEPSHGGRLIIKATLSWKALSGQIKTFTGSFLTDSGCSGATLNRDLVIKEKMTIIKREVPVPINQADGSAIKGAGVYYTPPYTMRIGSHQEISWEVSQLKDDIAGYLPILWLEKHNPDIDWPRAKITWRSDYCKKNCLPMTSAVTGLHRT